MITVLHPVTCLDLFVRVDIQLYDDAPAVVLDFLCFPVFLNCRLSLYVEGVKPYRLRAGIGIDNCLVGVLNSFVGAYVAHAIRVVWHGELCDVERNAPCLCIGELDDFAGFVNMGHFIWGKSFAMFLESQSERCLHSSLCRFTQRLLTSYLWKHCCFLDCSISFLVVSLVFPFGQDITKSVGKKSTFLYLRPLGTRRLVFVVAVISLPPPGGCS